MSFKFKNKLEKNRYTMIRNINELGYLRYSVSISVCWMTTDEDLIRSGVSDSN